MTRWRYLPILCLTFFVACDCSRKTEETPANDSVEFRPSTGRDEEADRKAWAELERSLEAAGDDEEERMILIDMFRGEDPDHPRLVELEEEIEQMRARRQASAIVREASRRVGDAVLQARNERIPDWLVRSSDIKRWAEFAAFDSIQQMVATADAEQIVTRPDGATHPVSSQNLDFVSNPPRSRLLNLLRRTHPNTFQGRCDFECQSDLISAALQPALRLRAYGTGVARLNPRAIENLLRGLPISEDMTFLGLPVAEAYVPFRNTLHEYIRVYKAVESTGADRAMMAYRSALNANRSNHAPGRVNPGMDQFYANFTTNHEIAEKSNASPYKAKMLTGFWMRRMDDGTAPLIVDWVKAFADVYDEELSTIIASE